MSSAFRNFFITFAVCLLIFGFLGFKFAYPWLTDIVDFTDMSSDTSETVSGEESADVSEETSEPTPPPSTDYDENGDVFTAFIMSVDSNNRMLTGVFIDSNGKSSQYIYCPMSPTVKAVNEVGASVPIGDMYSLLTPQAVCQNIGVLTGIETKYCLRFNRESLKTLAELIPGANVVLNEDITIVNPKYADEEFADGAEYPDDYNIVITNVDGKVLLNETLAGKTKLEWLLYYNPLADGSEYNELYTKISKSLFKQFFDHETALKKKETFDKLIKCCDTNLTADAANGHLETIFSHNNFNYQEVAYPNNWAAAVATLRELDGSYNR